MDRIKFIYAIGVFVFFSTSSFAEEDTPVTHEPIVGINEIIGSREWREPNYDYAIKPLGYEEDSFKVPKGLEARVDFWKKIYTKYTTQQGIIHDVEDVSAIYKEVDFSDINESVVLTARQKEKQKQKRVDEFKNKIVAENPKLKLSDLRFQLGQRDRIQTAIYISGRYIEDFEDVFRQNNLPLELVRLVFVESSFNVLARSKVGASGLWQIMPSNAKPYKMISKAVDKRNHPIEATKLASKILRNNYMMLGDWSLAVTGYNHGPTGVMKMTKKYKTRSLAELIDNVNSRKSFGFASKNFYASFLAILEVEKNASKYFKSIKWSKRLNGENLKLQHAVDYKYLHNWFDENSQDLQLFNPHLTRHVVVGKKEIPSGTWVMIPEKNYLTALSDLAKIKRKPAEVAGSKWRVSSRERTKKTKND
jgi:membrane-bound lytic murein transglycosylase D